MHLKNKSLLITGGTGSFGNAFVDRVLELKQIPKRLIILVGMNSNSLKWKKNIKTIKMQIF